MSVDSEFNVVKMSLIIPSIQVLRKIAAKVFRERLVEKTRYNQYWINEDGEGAQLCFEACQDGFKCTFLNCNGEYFEELRRIFRLFAAYHGELEVSTYTGDNFEQLILHDGEVYNSLEGTDTSFEGCHDSSEEGIYFGLSELDMLKIQYADEIEDGNWQKKQAADVALTVL